MTFTLSPTVTFANAATVLAQGLTALAAGQTTLDLAPLTDVDSSMVAVLLAWERAARQRGASLVLQNIPEKLHSLAGVYGIADLLLAPHRH